MKLLGIIPARGGSKGIPNKNIKKLAGVPLIEYTFKVAKKSKYIDTLILSSEDQKIIDVAKKLGIEVPFIRPRFLASDISPTLEVIKHALLFYQEKNIFYDGVILLQTTSPFRKLKDIDDAIQKFIKIKSDSLISVRKVPHEYNPHWCFEEKDGLLKVATGDKIIIPNRQTLPEAFHRDGSIYIMGSKTILSKNSILGDSISYIISSNDFHVNLDTMEDWQKAENFLKYNNE